MAATVDAPATPAPLPDPLPPLPGDGLAYVPLPASGDDGFPQAFLLQFAGVVYRVTMAVYYPDPGYVVDGAFAGVVFDLPDPARGLYLNLKVEVESRTGPDRLLGARRVVTGLPMAFGPLRFRFSRIRVAQGNLAGPGARGSELLAEVAVADA
jgi:hypothetical protein